jgi:murein DD-endopeptidase MepM/ murein hydrolase activator NlpD
VSQALARVLGLYAQLFFSRSPWVGALLLAATFLEPVTGAGGLLAALVGVGVARALGLDAAEAWHGAFGVNALLVGLGLAHTYPPSGLALGLVLLGALAAVVVTAALKSLLASVAGLPVLSAPFLLVYPVVLLVGRQVGLAHNDAGSGQVLSARWPLEALGSILFLPRWDVGALVLLALLVHSRIATVFAAASLAVVTALLAALPGAADPVLWRAAALNAMVTALGLTSVWFVPSASALGLAVVGAVLCLLVTAGLAGVGAPALILPFYASTVLLLLAARQRAVDQAPKAIDFVPGTPEENLRHFRTQRARFASLHPVAFHLPFRGAWTCTQGVDGAFTHQGPWRHGFDFEVKGEDSKLFSRGGDTPEAHHCFRLPVLAAADGTVVSVQDQVADNAVGALDLAHNWGNVVVLQHAPGLFSLVAHLAQHSVKVVPGQVVQRGAVVGLCGSSGRSPRPHLHFQLQATAEVGAPTLPCRFADVVRVADDGEALLREVTCAEGDTLRSLESEDDVARCLQWPVGVAQTAQLQGRQERVTAEVDLYGRHVLRSDLGGVLYFRRGATGFVAEDDLGPQRSVVRLLRVALARVPFEARASMRWTDLVPSRWQGGVVRRTLRDFVAPFVTTEGLEVDYALTREAGLVVVTGQSQQRDGRGVPRLTSRATLSALRGLVSVEVTVRGRTVRATFTPLNAADTPTAATVQPNRWGLVPAPIQHSQRGEACAERP